MMAISTARNSSMLDIAGFEYWLIQSGRKPRTVLKYHKELIRLQREVEPFTPENFEAFLLRLRQSGCTARYINMFIMCAKVYARWSNIEGFEGLRDWKEVKPIKSTMSDDEIDRFLTLPKWARNQSQDHYNRWTLFYSILAYTGMRPGECAKLTIDDVDFGRMVFILRDTKTNDNRLVPIPPHLLESLEKHLLKLTNDCLFASLRDGNKDGLGVVVDNVDWHYNFHSRLKRLGIKRKGLSPYSLRHSIITRLLEEDVNLFKVQKLVGHKRLDTTLAYTHLTTKDMHDTVSKDPLSKRRLTPKDKIRALKEYLKKINLEDPDIEYEYIEDEKGFRLEVREVTPAEPVEK